MICLTSQSSGQAIPAKSEAALKFVVPPEPLLRPPPESAKWTVTFSYQDELKPTASAASKAAVSPPADLSQRPRQITTTKTANSMHEEITDLQGRVRERWVEGATLFTKETGGSAWVQMEPAGSPGEKNDPEHALSLAPGFADLSWVSTANYAGAIKYGGFACFVFVPGGETAIDLTNPEKVKSMWKDFPLVACIESRHRLPVAVRFHDETRSFKWESAPTSPLVLPAELAAQIQKRSDEMAKQPKQATPPQP
ncbi:MAG: hypothetical protein H0X40_00475 [Chthoniobacterales bacterium]|nr:hypothetical protein [Chthoniobacterales bacterium]